MKPLVCAILACPSAPECTLTPTYNPHMPEERNRAERVLSVIDGVRGVFGGLLVFGVAIAAMNAGGVAGWALGAGLLGFLGGGLTLVIRRHA